MKKVIYTIGFLCNLLISYAQIDSVAFNKSYNAEIQTTITIDDCNQKSDKSVSEIYEDSLQLRIIEEKVLSTNKQAIFQNAKRERIAQYILTVGSCKYTLPKYSLLTEGVCYFKKIKADAQASISALGSTLSIDHKSEFYVYYFTRYKKFGCPNVTTRNRVLCGVGVFVILKISNLRTKLEIKNLYDIAAIGQLGLAEVELDVRHFGMKPSLADKFLPGTLGKIDIQAAKYFDQLLENSKTKINDLNTEPAVLPYEL